jgi:hypothetical protein
MTNKIEAMTLEQQWMRCKGHVQKVYETERSIFLKCQKGHKKPTEENKVGAIKEYPVFMVRKIKESTTA